MKENKKFKITCKITNSDETQTICANNGLLKMIICKNKISDYVKDYLY